MKRSFLPFFVIITVTIVIVGMLTYSWYIVPKEIADQKNPDQLLVKIVNFTIDKSFHGCLVGVTTDVWFNVTVKNTGSTNISQVIVYVDLIPEGNESLIADQGGYIYVSFENKILELNWNETIQIRAMGFTSIMDYHRVVSHNFNATLVVNGTILDAKTLY